MNLLTLATYTKLGEILSCLALSLSITLYETSSCMPNCRYTYRLPFNTKFNPDYYSRDQILCHIAESLTPNAIPITMPIPMPIKIPKAMLNTVPNTVPNTMPKTMSMFCKVTLVIVLPGIISQVRLHYHELLNRDDNCRLQMDMTIDPVSRPAK